jgi:hypothetical protein
MGMTNGTFKLATESSARGGPRAFPMMPNFFIIGAMRAGTTSLYYYLKEHPEVYMSPRKEPTFFVPGVRWKKAITELGAYQALFEDVSGEKAIGEASTAYLTNRSAAERIREYVPNARLIAILRDPADRAYSNFLHYLRLGEEQMSDFARAVKDGPHREMYLRLGFYHAQLTHYFELFDRRQMRIYLYDDLKRDSLGLVKDIYGFLGVDENFVPRLERYNVSVVPKSRLVHSFLVGRGRGKGLLQAVVPAGVRRSTRKALSAWNVARRPAYPPHVRRTLTAIYREDILRLQDAIGRDLSNWLR